MNRTKEHALERAVKATRRIELQGGDSGPRPDGGTLLTLPPIKTHVVQAKLIPGDPNGNGGLDANGYEKALIVTPEYSFTNVNWPEVRLDVSSLPDAAKTIDDGTYVYGFIIGFTSDGYMLLEPTIFAGSGKIHLGIITTDIPKQGSGQGVVELYDSLLNDLHTTVSPVALTGYKMKAGCLVNLFWDPIKKQWYTPDRQSVQIGTVQGSAGSSISAGSTGSVTIRDDQGNTLYTQSGVRMLDKVYSADTVFVVFDYTQAEYFAWPDHATGSKGIAKDIDFHLTGTLTTSDATTTNFTIDAFNNGTDPAAGGTVVTLQNMTASSNYIFSGANGHYGWATLTSTDPTHPTYKIRQMECP